MRQQKKRQPHVGDNSASPEIACKIAEDVFPLTRGERRIIRNYRAMERIAQKTFEDISEDFACSLPALGRHDLSALAP